MKYVLKFLFIVVLCCLYGAAFEIIFVFLLSRAILCTIWHLNLREWKEILSDMHDIYGNWPFLKVPIGDRFVRKRGRFSKSTNDTRLLETTGTESTKKRRIFWATRNESLTSKKQFTCTSKES